MTVDVEVQNRIGTQNDTKEPPKEPYGRLFLRFLRFGFLAWGGPVAQIAMIQRELVEEEGWISRERFNRTLAVYQILPGPEAHELCVYFGMLARGRLGGLLGGLGFMLPGFVLMFILSWFYLTFGINSAIFQAIFFGFQAAVVAVIVRAVHRIGGHALTDGWLFGIATVALAAELWRVHFALILIVAGLTYVLVKRKLALAAVALEAVFLVAAVTLTPYGAEAAAQPVGTAASGTASISQLLFSGLRAGLLTFGGAYTVIPFLQRDAVLVGGWMTNAQFLNGLALSGILPAPLIIFSTFVGYVGGGPLGALAMTLGIFLPAFSFTLVGHDYLERVVQNPSVHTFLNGVTAGVVGLIAATTVVLFQEGITSLPALIIFTLALLAIYLWKAKAAVAGIVLGAGLLGLLLFGG
ncbi:MAG: chromate efflux transporter [Chloroflexi bacterium]|nr:chromate efflux transporter [Chloroflexota bacterium]MCI0575611.1 chromate efflux transporter [Chloroflexota bacterium]MCI0645052.1 chromate efflux transporter [Chloroflexota bacterium]MCI0731888.1 chromate efflux transporter [Chloroflexota bacterium]